jgi:hypothetical protein
MSHPPTHEGNVKAMTTTGNALTERRIYETAENPVELAEPILNIRQILYEPNEPSDDKRRAIVTTSINRVAHLSLSVANQQSAQAGCAAHPCIGSRRLSDHWSTSALSTFLFSPLPSRPNFLWFPDVLLLVGPAHPSFFLYSAGSAGMSGPASSFFRQRRIASLTQYASNHRPSRDRADMFPGRSLPIGE